MHKNVINATVELRTQLPVDHTAANETSKRARQNNSKRNERTPNLHRTEGNSLYSPKTRRTPRTFQSETADSSVVVGAAMNQRPHGGGGGRRSVSHPPSSSSSDRGPFNWPCRRSLSYPPSLPPAPHRHRVP